MQTCATPIYKAGCLSPKWPTCSSKYPREPSAAADNVQRSALQCNGLLRGAAPLCVYRAVFADSRSIARRMQQAGQGVGLSSLNPIQPKQQLGASHFEAREKRQASVCRSSLHQVAPLYEIAAGGETINPWSLIALGELCIEEVCF